MRRAPGRAADGGASTIELLLITPLVVILTFLPIQLGLWMHGRNLVSVAAQEAARDAAAADLTPVQAELRGREAAESFVVDQKVVDVESITVSRGPDMAQATVSGVGLSVLPGLRLRVSGSAQSAVEEFVGVGP